jgi:hypothetical protein
VPLAAWLCRGKGTDSGGEKGAKASEKARETRQSTCTQSVHAQLLRSPRANSRCPAVFANEARCCVIGIHSHETRDKPVKPFERLVAARIRPLPCTYLRSTVLTWD